MLASLSTAQLASAKLSTTFNDIALGPNKDGQFPTTKLGIAVSTLSDAQKLLEFAVMKPWTNDVDDAIGTANLKLYENELAGTYISFRVTLRRPIMPMMYVSMGQVSGSNLFANRVWFIKMKFIITHFIVIIHGTITAFNRCLAI